MNVLKLAQDVARKIGISPPAALFSSTEPIAIRMIALLEDEARFLRNQGNWPQQKKTHTITVSSGRRLYPLPSDFQAWVTGSEYDLQYGDRLVGPVTDSVMGERRYGDGSTSRVAFRVKGPDGNPASSGGQIEIDPTPGNNTDQYTFEYYTKNLFYTSDYATGAETIGADTNVCIFDDDIVLKGVEWRYRESKGQQFETQKAEHARMVSSALSRWSSVYRGSMNGSNDRLRYSTPSGGWSF